MKNYTKQQLLAGAMALALAPERKDDDVATVMAEIKKSVDGVMRAHEEFKATNDQRLKEIEKKGASDPATEAKLKKIEEDLNRYEDLNGKLVAAQEQAKKDAQERAELKSEFDKLQIKLNRPRAPTAEEALAELRKSTNLWAKAVFGAYIHGVANLPDDQRKALEDAAAAYKSLSLTNDTTGGYLAPAQFVAEIIKGVTLISPIRTLARVRTTSQKSIILPKRIGQFAAQWTAKMGGIKTETTGLQYGAWEIFTHELFALIDISNANLEDSAFDLAAEVQGEAVEQFGVAEGAGSVSGDGVGQMEGFLKNADTVAAGNVSKSGDANLVTADGVIGCYHDIKTAYARTAVWTLNRKTLGSVRKLKDGEGQYLFMMGLPNGAPNTILGSSYVEFPDMPDVAAGAYPMAFGDFQKGYTLVDRIDMQMLRDPYTQATSGNVRFIFRKRTGGQVVLPEAIRPLLISA